MADYVTLLNEHREELRARITELENALNLALPFVDYCDAIGMVTAAEAREAARKVLGEGE